MSRRDTRKLILEEAERQFISCGITNTQMKLIADAVGINRRTLYRYYPTKEELAFAVELEVLKKLQFDPVDEAAGSERLSGFEKVERYINNVRLDGMEELIRYTAEFDRYFQGDYPSSELEQSLILSTDPQEEVLFQYIIEGVSDGSVRGDIDPLELFMFINQTFLGLFQRLIIREQHLVHEHCEDIDFPVLFRKIVLQGIKNISR